MSLFETIYPIYISISCMRPGFKRLLLWTVQGTVYIFLFPKNHLSKEKTLKDLERNEN